MRKLNIIFALVALAGFSSCLKESPNFDPDKSNTVIEIHQRIPDLIASPTTSTYPLFIETFNIAPEANFDVVIRLAGTQAASTDITVTLDIDPDALDIYNTENGDHMIVLPSTHYTVASWSGVIKAGQKEVIIPFKLKPGLFDFAEAYALPLTIKTVSSGTISGNFGTVVYSIGAKNEWEGPYRNTYVTNNLGSGANNILLNTAGPTRVKMSPGLIGVYGNEVWLDIDPATNKVTVTMVTLLPVSTDPISHYDPATKTFNIKFYTNNGGRTITQTLVRQ